jgi:myo-inositol 2-dehydrogenase/D-chiro-inositol 1-dehydrogenase
VTIRIGFFGAGLIAGFHARSLRASKADFEFAGVYDVSSERAAEFAGWTGATAVSSEESVLASCDAVYVCTWTSEHPRLVALAASHGKPVFCEKPLGVGLSAAQSMAAAVSSAGVANQVGLVLRSSPSLALLEHLLRDPESGRLLSITFHDDQILPVQGWYQSDWRGDPSLAGSGVLLEHSIHDIDVLERLGGPAASVAANSETVHGIAGIEDVMAATFRYAGGGVANLTTIWHDIPERLNDRRIEVTCSRFWAVLEGEWIGPLSWQRPGVARETLQGEKLIARVDELGLTRPNADGDFVDAVASGRPASPDFADALRAHVVVDAAYRSAASGGSAVTIPTS